MTGISGGQRLRRGADEQVVGHRLGDHHDVPLDLQEVGLRQPGVDDLSAKWSGTLLKDVGDVDGPGVPQLDDVGDPLLDVGASSSRAMMARMASRSFWLAATMIELVRSSTLIYERDQPGPVARQRRSPSGAAGSPAGPPRCCRTAAARAAARGIRLGLLAVRAGPPLKSCWSRLAVRTGVGPLQREDVHLRPGGARRVEAA